MYDYDCLLLLPLMSAGNFAAYNLQGKQDQALFWEKQIKDKDRMPVHVIVL